MTEAVRAVSSSSADGSDWIVFAERRKLSMSKPRLLPPRLRPFLRSREILIHARRILWDAAAHSALQRSLSEILHREKSSKDSCKDFFFVLVGKRETVGMSSEILTVKNL